MRAAYNDTDATGIRQGTNNQISCTSGFPNTLTRHRIKTQAIGWIGVDKLPRRSSAYLALISTYSSKDLTYGFLGAKPSANSQSGPTSCRVNPKRAAKRTARSTLRGSSRKVTIGESGVRMMPSRRSSTPLKPRHQAYAEFTKERETRTRGWRRA